MPHNIPVPREKEMMSHPAYVIEPPDILLVDAVRLVPKPPYVVQPLDILQIHVDDTPLDKPISDFFGVDPGGRVNLGPSYGSVKVSGLTIQEATAAIEKHLSIILAAARASVTLAQTAGQQQVVGEHLVGPDGMVNLGIYGQVYVSGMTLPQARAAIEAHLAQFLDQPKISLDVFAYNSKVYYIIFEGAGNGDQVLRPFITGNENVLDAIAQAGGTARFSSSRMWIARPVPGNMGCNQILPIEWNEIVKGGSAETNYQILPGDRVFVAEDKMVAFDTTVDKLKSPFERMFGFMLLGVQSIQYAQRFPEGLNNQGF